MQRIFAEFIGGTGMHLIASGLNRDGILSPSGHDPDRKLPSTDRPRAVSQVCDRIDGTCEILARASEPDPDTEDRETRLCREIAAVDRQLERYRAVLDQGDDPPVVAHWISDAQGERKILVAQLGEPVPGGKLTTNQVMAPVAGLRDIVSTLADADPEDKAELYRELGVNPSYSPDGRVNVQVLPRGVNVRVGGRLEP